MKDEMMTYRLDIDDTPLIVILRAAQAGRRPPAVLWQVARKAEPIWQKNCQLFKELADGLRLDHPPLLRAKMHGGMLRRVNEDMTNIAAELRKGSR